MFRATQRRRAMAAAKAELRRLEWTADRMLLDADESFANELGIRRPEPPQAPSPAVLHMLAALAAGQQQGRAMGQFNPSEQQAQIQAQLLGSGRPLGSGIGGLIGGLGLGRLC